MSTKMYQLSGVSPILELGKEGFQFSYDSVNGWVKVLQSDGTTLGNLQVAEPTVSSDVSTKRYVDVTIANLVDSAPGTLDTLNELAAALGDDPNFATTITNLINEIDANVDDLVTLSGVAENSVDLGSFTGTTITANNTVKGALQEIETGHDVVRDLNSHLITLSGVAAGSTDLGLFSGATIANGATVKGALQSIVTAHEEVDANVDNLITAVGIAENATDMGSFSGTIIPENTTVKIALQSLETHLGEMEHGCRYITLDALGGTSVNVGDVIPTNMVITDVRLKVTTPWDSAAPTMEVGVAGDTALVAGSQNFNLKDAGSSVQLVDAFYKTSGDTQFLVTINNDSATVGAAELLLDMCEVM